MYKIAKSKESRELLMKGVDELADTVKVTLGPKGKCVLIERDMQDPIITKDGVTVAKSITLDNPVMNMAAQMLKKVAISTNDKAGDGTTTATVLAQAILKASQKFDLASYNSTKVRVGMNTALQSVIKYIDSVKKPVAKGSELLVKVAEISANGDTEVAKLVVEAVEKSGASGVVTIENSQTGITSVDTTDGVKIDRGYLSPYFMTDPDKGVAAYDDPLICIIDQDVSSFEVLVPYLQESSRQGKALLIIANDITDNALTGLIMNRIQRKLPVVAIKSPGFSQTREDSLKDLSIITGATIVGGDLGEPVGTFTPDYFGSASSIKISQDESIILEGNGDPDEIKARTELVQNLYDTTKTEYEKDNLRNRLANLKGEVAVIRVGGISEVETKELRDRVEDAVNAVKSALADGVVPGGGTTYIGAIYDQAEDSAEDNEPTAEDIGRFIVIDALNAPFATLCENSGIRTEELIYSVSAEEVYDFNNDKMVNPYKAGILDPAKVLKLAITNAISVAGTILLTDRVVYKEDDSENPA